MARVKKNQDGIGLIESIIIILIVLILGFVGWYVWRIYNGNNQSRNNNSETEQTTSSTSPQPPAEPHKNKVTIKSLGVRIDVSDSLKDLLFVSKSGQLSNKTKYSAVMIGSSTLSSLDSKCKATSTVAPLGEIYKTEGTYPTEANSKNSTGQLIKQFDKFYIAYSAPKSFCSTKKNVQEEETLLRNDLNTALSTFTEK